MTGTHAFAIGARTWADGSGRWHVAIPEDRNDGTGLILDARRCILDELMLRDWKKGETEEAARARLSDYVVEHVARRHQQEPRWLGFVVFSEYDIDGDTDPEDPEEGAPTPTPSGPVEITASGQDDTPLSLHIPYRGALSVTLDDLRALAGLLATFDLTSSAASQHYIETGELSTHEEIAAANSPLDVARAACVPCKPVEVGGVMVSLSPCVDHRISRSADYADKIAEGILPIRGEEASPLGGGDTARWIRGLIATGARQGYALGMGAAE